VWFGRYVDNVSGESGCLCILPVLVLSGNPGERKLLILVSKYQTCDSLE
jgi:hypothetical protein